MKFTFNKTMKCLMLMLSMSLIFGCQTNLPLIEKAPIHKSFYSDYRIGPGDSLLISVWRNPEFSLSVPVRPDGKISLPLVDDVVAAHKTPMELTQDLESALAHYLKEPLVTVIVTSFVGTYEDNIRVVGEASQPQAIPYRSGMTLLDVMIAVGGLTDFADGNRATLIRQMAYGPISYRARLEDLVKDGEINANALVLPGDVIIIPEAFF